MCLTRRKLIISEMKWSKLRCFSAICSVCVWGGGLLVYLLVCIPTGKLPQIKQLLPPSRTTPKKNPAVSCTRDWDPGSSHETNEVKRMASTKKTTTATTKKKTHWKWYSTKCEHNDNNFYRFTNTLTRYVPVLPKTTKYNSISNRI